MVQSNESLTQICVAIRNDPNNLQLLQALKDKLQHSRCKTHIFNNVDHPVPLVMAEILSMMVPIKDRPKIPEKLREAAVDVLAVYFKQTVTSKMSFYKHIYFYICSEMFGYDSTESISEEYKLSLVRCMMSLNNSCSMDILFHIYAKDFIMCHSKVVHFCLELAKKEKYSLLRIAAIECIMSLGRIYKQTDLSDDVLLNSVSDTFMNFLPAISINLSLIAQEDSKTNHQVICVALKALGRFLHVLMRDYNNVFGKDDNFDLDKIFNSGKENSNVKVEIIRNKKFTTPEEVMKHLETCIRDCDWYMRTDEKLKVVLKNLNALCHHPHERIRLELCNAAGSLLTNYNTMPLSLPHITIILINLSEDDDKSIAETSSNHLKHVATLKSSNVKRYKELIDTLQENFHKLILNLPNTFNSIDDQRKLSSINLICGFISLFKRNQIISSLSNQVQLNYFVESLLYVCSLDANEIETVGIYGNVDFEVDDRRTPWRRFKHFSDRKIEKQLGNLFKSLSDGGFIGIVYDSLCDVLTRNESNKEAILLLVGIVSCCGDIELKFQYSKELIVTLLDDKYLSLKIACDETTLVGKAHENIIQICLILEGVAKLSSGVGGRSDKFMLRILYPILAGAGSKNPIIRLAGTAALKQLSAASGYGSIEEMLNKNSDYFSFHVLNKLNRDEYNKDALNILTVIMKHSSVDVLDSISEVVRKVHEQFTAVFDRGALEASFLQVFDVFARSLIRWLEVKIDLEPIKSKQQKIDELLKSKDDLLLNEGTDFSDDAKILKTDEGKDRTGEGEDQTDEEGILKEMPKREAPAYIEITVSILENVLNYIANSDKVLKIHALEVCRNGLDVIRDHTDHLLPVVHKIWDPLKLRFTAREDPLVFNFSFQLLATMARVAKDFIKRRTATDVLPAILEKLKELSRESHLKDRGSSYRHTQNYKLQLVLLKDLSRILTDVDIDAESLAKVLDQTNIYLSNKQPLPLQNLCVQLHKDLLNYDPIPVRERIILLNNNPEYEQNVNKIINEIR